MYQILKFGMKKLFEEDQNETVCDVTDDDITKLLNREGREDEEMNS